MLNCLAQVFLPTPPYDYLRACGSILCLPPPAPPPSPTPPSLTPTTTAATTTPSTSSPPPPLPHHTIIIITVIITTVINIIIVIVTRGLALYLRARPLGFTTSPWLLPDRPSATLSQAIRARDSCEPAKQSCRRTTAWLSRCHLRPTPPLPLFATQALQQGCILLPTVLQRPQASRIPFALGSPATPGALPGPLSLSTCSAACTACTVRDRWSLNLS